MLEGRRGLQECQARLLTLEVNRSSSVKLVRFLRARRYLELSSDHSGIPKGGAAFTALFQTSAPSKMNTFSFILLEF